MDRFDVHMMLVAVHKIVVRLVIARLPGAHRRHIVIVRHLVLYVAMEPVIAVSVMSHRDRRLRVTLLWRSGWLGLGWFG